jgi:ubiquitin carboxyl-terminal hydrolase 36/42
MGRWYSPKPDLENEKHNVVRRATLTFSFFFVLKLKPNEHLYIFLFLQGAALLNPDLWTCFLNCILQCMVHTVPLVLKLQEADHPDPCPRKTSSRFNKYIPFIYIAIENVLSILIL